MNHSAMNEDSDRPRLDRHQSEPILIMDDRIVNLSNLCPRGQAPTTTYSAFSNDLQRPRGEFVRKVSQEEESLYPKSLLHTLMDAPTAADVFRRTSRIQSDDWDWRGRNEEWDTNSGFNQGSSRPGAYQGSTAALQMKPPLPTWAEQSTEVEQKLETCLQPPPKHVVAPPAVSPFATTPSRWQDDYDYCSPPPASSSYPSTAQVEVSPGEYMPLRGSAETLAAIENGMARTVMCFCCEAKLLCVPDADLVICPDCRILSPIPVEEEKTGWMSLPVIPSDWDLSDSDEDDAPPRRNRGDQYCRSRSLHMGKQQARRGGVGLGLKVDYE